jgi:Holliday junction resolvasome RuvABC ATP-dependent DNA helicase subunit
MIGMETLKQSVFNQLIYFIQGFHLGETTEISPSKTRGDFKHTVIYGPPGTGKTEVAKIIGRMYANLGILKKGVFKKVTRNDLVAGYLGQTAIKTKNAITDCLGGVLFIDEAYSLSNSNDLDSFSKECLDTLCESLSDHKADLMVIIAGYEEDLEHHFFTANRGLDSRFVWRFMIDSYTPEELAHIFQKKIRESGWKTESDKVVDEKWFERYKDTFRHFGRDMEMLFLYTKISHSRRVFGKPSIRHRTLTKTDIEKGYELFLKNAKPIKENTTRKLLESMYI